MRKIVIHPDFGGFSLGKDSVLRARELSTDPIWFTECTLKGESYSDGSGISGYDRSYGARISRDNPILVQIVEEELEPELKVVEIPDDVLWYIHEYDGSECVHEQHRSWY